MKRRQFIAGIVATTALPLFAHAQQSGRLPVVGSLWSPADADGAASRRLPLLKGLAELGYVPSKNFIFEERYAAEVPERFDALAVELVNLKVDVLVGAGGSAIWALHRATTTIPIVFIAAGDPVAQGFALSLSKPGKNISGVSQMSVDLAAKRLQFFRQAIPSISNVALLRDPTNFLSSRELSQFTNAARELGLSYQVFDVNSANDIDLAFPRMAERNLQAVFVFTTNLLLTERGRISALGLKHRIAVMAPSELFVDAGALLSYGPDLPALWVRGARYIDRILKGEKVGDIPIEQPIKFDLSVNRKTAMALGIEIPTAMLALADKVIE